MQEQQQGGNHCLRVMTHFDVESSSSVHNVMMPQHQAPQVGHIHRRLGIANICHFQKHPLFSFQHHGMTETYLSCRVANPLPARPFSGC
jgi:hypothetical protein